MTGARVRRADENATLGDHEDRIRALERSPHSFIYVDDRELAADAPAVVFNSFPTTLSVLELTWFAWLVGGSPADLLYAALNGDYPITGSDYFWNVAMANQQGSEPPIDTSGGGSQSWGGLGWIADGVSVDGSGNSWGRVRFPNYQSAAFNSAKYVGEAAWNDVHSGTPDAWAVGGYRDLGGPATEIALFSPGGDLGAGSRFTLTGY